MIRDCEALADEKFELSPLPVAYLVFKSSIGLEEFGHCVIILCVEFPLCHRRQGHRPREEEVNEQDLRNYVHSLAEAR